MDKMKKFRKPLIAVGGVIILAVVVLVLKFGLSGNPTNGRDTETTTGESISVTETDLSESSTTGESDTAETTLEESSETQTTTAPEESSETQTTTAQVQRRIPNLLEIRFFHEYAMTEASNQFALWIEDASGRLVRTIFVTSFTSTGNDLSGGVAGYTFRDDTLPVWVGKASPGSMSDGQLDAISGATPEGGILRYEWNLKDDNGNIVPDGIYTFNLEGTLYWSSGVRFYGRFEVGGSEIADIAVSSSYTSLETQNRDMISSVSASFLLK